MTSFEISAFSTVLGYLYASTSADALRSIQLWHDSFHDNSCLNFQCMSITRLGASLPESQMTARRYARCICSSEYRLEHS